MTDHELTSDWLREVTQLLAGTDHETDVHLVNSLRAIRELNRRARMSRSVMGWCTCEECFRWSCAERDDFLIENLLENPTLFEEP